MQNSQCSYYCTIKSEHCQEKFLAFPDFRVVSNVLRFRTRSHHLPVTKNRFNPDIKRDLLLCSLCNQNALGDEHHYLYECHFFKEQRQKLDRNDENELSNVGKFMNLIMKKFQYETKPKSSVKVSHIERKAVISRSGREIVAPRKLDL